MNRPISSLAQKDNNGFFTFNDFTYDKPWVALMNVSFPDSVYNGSVNIIPYVPVELTVRKSQKTLALSRPWINCAAHIITMQSSVGTTIYELSISCTNHSITITLPTLPVGRYTLRLYRTPRTRAKAPPELMETITLNIEADPVVCFKEGTRILTSTGYVPIEKLRKGALVKTLRGYKPMCMMSKNTIEHGANPTRVANQLYKCSKATHPVFEDLVLTGSHAILVDEKQEGAMVEGKYKLPAFMDKNAVVYEVPGVYSIYHIALEDANEYVNYGIYANGLLVESCSKYVLKNKLGMTEMTENFALSKIIYPKH